MIATPVEALPKGMLPRPELHISKNCVAEALDHLTALRKIYAQMRANELERLKQGLVVITKIPSQRVTPRQRGYSKFDQLMK